MRPMKCVYLLILMFVFVGCSNEDHENDGDILGPWTLTREIVVQTSDQVQRSINTEEILHSNQAIVYDFKKDNQLLIKEEGKTDLLMRYSCYSDFGSRFENPKFAIQEFIDINNRTYILSHSEGKLILDASQRNGPILYLERN